MSSETQPIDPARFALALEDLPLDALHSKAAEIRNSRSKLRESNSAMLPFAEAGDDDCREAMFENLGVIGRMNQRIELLRVEVVEKRGMPWVGEEGEEEVRGGGVNGEVRNGLVNGGGNAAGERAEARSGRLTDEELRRQVEAQLGEDDDDEEGVHL